MASTNKKIWIIVAAGAVAGLGGALYLARVVGERGDRRIIATQVEGWAEVWRSARRCLLGDSPAVSDARDAALLRLGTSPDAAGAIRACDRTSMRRLVRPGDEQTGVPAIEDAWAELRQAVSALGRGYAGVVDRSSSAPAAERWERLGRGIAQVDEAYATLRRVSELAPDPPPGDALARLPAATPIRAGQRAVAPIAVDSTGEALVIEGELAPGDEEREGARQRARVTVRGPARVDVEVQAPNRLVAADEAAWGVWFSRTPADRIELRAGSLPAPDTGADSGAGSPAGGDTGDEAGGGEAGDGPGAGGSAGARGGAVVAVTATETEDISALFAIGGGDVRAVYFQRFDEGVDPALLVSRSVDRGARWGRPAELARGPLWMFPEPLRGRVDLVWLGGGNAVWLAATRDEPAPAPRVLAAAPEGLAGLDRCASASATWWSMPGGEVVRGDAAGVARAGAVRGGLDLASCDDARAALTGPGDDGAQVWLCAAGACPLALLAVAPPSSDHAVALVGERPVVLVQVAHVAILWRASGAGAPDAAPDAEMGRAFRVPEGAGRLHSLHVWDGKLYAAFRTEGAVSLVEIPTA